MTRLKFKRVPPIFFMFIFVGLFLFAGEAKANYVNWNAPAYRSAAANGNDSWTVNYSGIYYMRYMGDRGGGWAAYTCIDGGACQQVTGSFTTTHAAQGWNINDWHGLALWDGVSTWLQTSWSWYWDGSTCDNTNTATTYWGGSVQGPPGTYVSNACSGNYAAGLTSSGGYLTANNTAGGYLGAISYQCSVGNWVLSSSLCVSDCAVRGCNDGNVCTDDTCIGGGTIGAGCINAPNTANGTITSYSACSTSCGTGTRTAYTSCGGSIAGQSCTDNSGCCSPVNGTCSGYGAWSACSNNCGTGTQTRTGGTCGGTSCGGTCPDSNCTLTSQSCSDFSGPVTCTTANQATTCNDSDSTTADTCNNPGTCTSSCVHTVVTDTLGTGADPIIGVCGLANGAGASSAPASNLCSSGSASSVTGTGPWSWTCSGTNGGMTASCTAPVWACGTSYSTVSDVDGNTYNTILVGAQCWMASDMMTSKYPNSASINRGPTTATWNGADNAYYAYPADTSNTAEETLANIRANSLGFIYQWSAAMQGSTSSGAQGICPSGWHVPTDNELYTLENYLKDNGQTCVEGRASATWDCSGAGTKLAVGGASGFNKPLSGYRSETGVLNFRNSYATLWSSTQVDASYSWSHIIGGGTPTVARNTYAKARGWSVRCIKY